MKPTLIKSIGWFASCDFCESQEEGGHYCLLHSCIIKNMDTVRCEDYKPRNGSKTRKEGGIMKKSVNFNGSKTTQNKKYGTRSAFIKMAKYLGVPNKEIIESVKRAEGHSEPKNHEHDFMSGQCNCGMTETFFKDTPCQK